MTMTKFRQWVVLAAVPFAAATATIGLAEAPAPIPGVRSERDVAYGPHERNRLDVFTPEKAVDPLPLVVWVHGGGWVGGDKSKNPAMIFLKHGYAVASINYRFSNHAAYPAQIHDCKAAIRHLRANAEKYNVDPKRFGVYGASAGGHLVALLGTTAGVKELEGDVGSAKAASDVQAVCDVFGPADILRFTEHTGNDEAHAATSLLSRLVGGPVMEKKDVAKL
ncbi:MAG: alpha/beta hydrolase fold domain-containing protein, partial [Planctomycetia bacterium]